MKTPMITATDKRIPPKGSETHGGRVSPPPLRLTRERKGLAVWSEDRHLLTFSTDPRYRTHIHPLNAPGTECPMTRFRPVDHPWQYGVFVGLNKVNGLDFWCSGDAVYDPALRGTMRLRELGTKNGRCGRVGTNRKPIGGLVSSPRGAGPGLRSLCPTGSV
jgi:hypothetical protein